MRPSSPLLIMFFVACARGEWVAIVLPQLDLCNCRKSTKIRKIARWIDLERKLFLLVHFLIVSTNPYSRVWWEQIWKVMLGLRCVTIDHENCVIFWSKHMLVSSSKSSYWIKNTKKHAFASYFKPIFTLCATLTANEFFMLSLWENLSH